MCLIPSKLTEREAGIAGDSDCYLVIKATKEDFDFEVPNCPVSLGNSRGEHELVLYVESRIGLVRPVQLFHAVAGHYCLLKCEVLVFHD